MFGLGGKIINDLEFLQTLINTIPMSVVIVNDRRKLFYLNSYLEKIIDCSPKDATGLLGGEVFGCVHVLKKHNHRCGEETLCKKCILNKAIRSALEKKQPFWDEGFISVNLSGHTHNHSVSVSSSPLSFNGEKYKYMAINISIYSIIKY